MHCRCLVGALVFVGLICGGPLGENSWAQAQSLSATAGPQQMLPSDAPSCYPSTAAPGVQAYDNAVPSLMASPTSGVDGGVVTASPGELGVYDAPVNGTAIPIDSRPLDTNSFRERALSSNEPWSWQILPSGVMYKAYLASLHESRLATQWTYYRDQGWLWDGVIGGRAGLVRYGTESALWPEGWQVDMEAATFPRLDTRGSRDLIGDDFRLGIPITTRQGPWEAKFGYYHLSSHIGDEYLLKHLDFPRINYVRESLLLGTAVYLNPSLRLYFETGWAFYTDDGAKPWEFQFGVDFSSPEPTGLMGSPFFAVNTHLRQENDFSGNVNIETGWQWRGRTGHLFRMGMQYFNGMSEQYQFYKKFDEQFGWGIWYDY